jgi:hypothetical protein
MPERFAKERIQGLFEQCQDKYGRFPTLAPPPRLPQQEGGIHPLVGVACGVGCGLLAVLDLILVVVGIIHVVGWF